MHRHRKGSTSILNSLDWIEEGRADIYKWGEKRRSKRRGIRGHIFYIRKLFLDKTLMKSFLNNINPVVILQMLLAGMCTYACDLLNLQFDIQMTMFVSPLVFPLAFSINADFQRREKVLEDLAMFKGASMVLFFCHRDWLQSAELPPDFLQTVSNKLKGLILNIKEYLMTEKEYKRHYILAVIYEDLSDISQFNNKMRGSKLPMNSPLITRLIHCHNLMAWSFERLRVIREYRSPRSIRGFTKVFIFMVPLILSPYYVHIGRQATTHVALQYMVALLVSFIFACLQGVQDKLDDPFDGISEDDINLGQLEDWTSQAMLTNRTAQIGRFTVTVSTSQADETPSVPNRKSTVSSPVTRKDSFRKLRKKFSRRKKSVPLPETDSDEYDDNQASILSGQAFPQIPFADIQGNTTIRRAGILKKPNSISMDRLFSSANDDTNTDTFDSRVLPMEWLNGSLDGDEILTENEMKENKVKKVSFVHDHVTEENELDPEHRETSANTADDAPEARSSLLFDDDDNLPVNNTRPFHGDSKMMQLGLENSVFYPTGVYEAALAEIETLDDTLVRESTEDEKSDDEKSEDDVPKKLRFQVRNLPDSSEESPGESSGPDEPRNNRLPRFKVTDLSVPSPLSSEVESSEPDSRHVSNPVNNSKPKFKVSNLSLRSPVSSEAESDRTNDSLGDSFSETEDKSRDINLTSTPFKITPTVDQRTQQNPKTSDNNQNKTPNRFGATSLPDSNAPSVNCNNCLSPLDKSDHSNLSAPKGSCETLSDASNPPSRRGSDDAIDGKQNTMLVHNAPDSDHGKSSKDNQSVVFV